MVVMVEQTTAPTEAAQPAALQLVVMVDKPISTLLELVVVEVVQVIMAVVVVQLPEVTRQMPVVAVVVALATS
jgi:hypothetical protein